MVVVQPISCVQHFVTPQTAACQAPLSSTSSQNLLKPMSIKSGMQSNHLILCCSLLLPSVFPSIRVFSNELALCIRWSKYWSFSISPSNEYSVLIFFRIDWFDIYEVKWRSEVKWKLLTHARFLQPHGLYSPWNSPGQNTEMGSLSLLQGIFPTQGSIPGLTHCRWILCQFSHKISARILEWVAYPFSSRSSWPRNRIKVICIAGRFFTNWAMREAFDMYF